LETQVEKIDGRMAEEIASALESKDDKKKTNGKKKKKKPSKSEIASAIAGVVLAEMELWPEKVVELIGKSHPNKDSFLKGVAYVIGGYMHFAREGLDALVKNRKKEAELKTCGLLSSITKEIKELRKTFRHSQKQALLVIAKKRKQEIEEARRAINEKYNKMVAEIEKDADCPRTIELQERSDKITTAFENACATIDKEAKAVRDSIALIEESSADWNSDERRAARLEQGKDAVEEVSEKLDD
jgi:hypothetical protein